MKFLKDTREQEIFNALICKRTRFQVDGVMFSEKVIEGKNLTKLDREKLCEKRAKELYNLLIS